MTKRINLFQESHHPDEPLHRDVHARTHLRSLLRLRLRDEPPIRARRSSDGLLPDRPHPGGNLCPDDQHPHLQVRVAAQPEPAAAPPHLEEPAEVRRRHRRPREPGQAEDVDQTGEENFKPT